MYRLKRKYREKSLITLLPTGEAVCLSGEPFTRTEREGTKDEPPKTKEFRGITQEDIEKHKEHPKFKGVFEKFFEEARGTKKTEPKPKAKEEAKQKSKKSETKKTSKKGGDSKAKAEEEE